VGQALAGPLGVCTSVLDRNPGYWLVPPTVGIRAALPILEEVMSVRGLVVRSIEEILELGVGDGKFVDPE
jgi:hypothetical protein